MRSPTYDNGVVRLYQGDARDLSEIPDGSVHCIVTSPPYWGLRDYGLEPSVWGGDPGHRHEWENETVATEIGKGNWAQGVNGRGELQPGGVDVKREPLRSASVRAFCACGAWRGTLGLEPTIELYVEHIVEVFRELWRVLRKDGTCWLNIGDSHAATQGGRQSAIGELPQDGVMRRNDRKPKPRGDVDVGGWGPSQHGASVVPASDSGLKPKDLCLIPARVALALQADGWWVRSDVVWSKPNPMPESVTDRPTRSHEYLFLLTKAERYYYDADAIREQSSPGSHGSPHINPGLKSNASRFTTLGRWTSEHTLRGRNKRSVWEIATQPYPEAHFATFPEALVEPCILAGTSEHGVCPKGGAPWERVVERTAEGWHESPKDQGRRNLGLQSASSGLHSQYRSLEMKDRGWRPTCDHDVAPIRATVLDPFAGSGTTCVVAQKLGRRAIGVDMNPDYLALAEKRLAGVPLPLALGP